MMNAETPVPEQFAILLPEVATAFGLGEMRTSAFITEGLMNRNWRVETAAGAFAVKELLDVSPTNARRNLAVLGPLAALGLPVGEPISTIDGETVVEIEKRAFCAFTWIDGRHIPGARLRPDEVEQFGTLVAGLHAGLNTDTVTRILGKTPTPPPASVPTPHGAITKAKRFLAVIDALPSRTGFDDAAAAELHTRIRLIEHFAEQRPAVAVPPGPAGWTHGDLQYRNLLWTADRISAVLDWDRIAVRPLAEELARTAQVQFGLAEHGFDLSRIEAFTQAYRERLDMPDTTLADAAHRLWWKRMTDFWCLERHYDKGDHAADDIWTIGERQLAWWCEHREDVTEAFSSRNRPRA